MTYIASIPKIHRFGSFVGLLTESAANLRSRRLADLFSSEGEETEEERVPPYEDAPVPDGNEIFPNRRPPEEEEYLPNEKEVEIDEPQKEITDPYFPQKQDGLPPEREQEFPQSDPV